MKALLLSLLLLTTAAWAGDDLRGEVRGRVADAASGAPLAGAIVVARWTTELPPNPASLLLAPIGGHGPGAQLRTARVAETLSAADGSFSFAAFTQEEQINQGPIVFNGPIVFAFLPGYEPQYVERGEAKLYRYGTKPYLSPYTTAKPPATVENLRSFLYWLDKNIGDADGEGAGTSMRLPQPGQRVPGESRRQEQARTAQTNAMRTVREELVRLVPPRPQAEPRGTIIELPPGQRKPGFDRIEVSAPPAPQSNPSRSGDQR